jgi:hypothetical protein
VADARVRRRFAAHEAVGRTLVERYGLRVRHGPFAGLELGEGVTARARAIGPKLLGTYESELEPFVEAAAADAFRTVVNVGAAEGYFAAGLARRIGTARVVAFEMAAPMRSMLAQTLRANGLEDRVEVRGECTPGELRAVADGERCLVVIDCEGAELELMDPAAVPGLLRAAAIVELHDFIRPEISATLLGRFSATHDLAVVSQPPGRVPHRPELDDLPPEHRPLAVDELRPAAMSWLVMAPHGATGPFADAVRAYG